MHKYTKTRYKERAVCIKASQLKHLFDQNQFIHNLFLSDITIGWKGQTPIQALQHDNIHIYFWVASKV